MRFANDDDLVKGTAYQNSTFQYSGIRPEKLPDSNYTLATIAMDTTGSLNGCEGDLLMIYQEIIKACHRSPAKNNLLLRVVEFNSHVRVKEIHGFLPLMDIDPSKYVRPVCEGLTPLYDAMYSAISAEAAYSRTLVSQDFNVNGVCFVITDGYDNVSTMSKAQVAQEIKRAVQQEEIESINGILLAAGAVDDRRMEDIRAEAGFNQYVGIGDINNKKIGRLAGFISQSISSTSQSLNSGGPSQPLTF